MCLNGLSKRTGVGRGAEGLFVFLLSWCLLMPVVAVAADKPVVVARAALRELQPVNWYIGTVISRERARLAAEVSGRLLWVAEVGAHVQKGEVVARIDDTLLKDELVERRADVTRIEAQLKFLRDEVSRLQRLAKQNNAARSQLEKAISERASAQSELTAAQARVRRVAEQVKRSRLEAPFAGIVTERLLHAGEWADEGSAVLAMTDPVHLEVQSWVSVSALPYIETGRELAFVSAGRRYRGKVRTLVPVGELRSRLYELRLGLPEGKWRVGESVRIAVPAATARKVLSVPRDALVLRRGYTAVYRIDAADHVARKVLVDTGVASGPYIEVQGEIQPGDLVVIRGGERLRDGDRVAIREQESSQ